MQPSNELLQALAVTAECCGTELSATAGRIMASDLASYPEQAVLKALVKVRREHQGRLTLASIISRIDDGRPGPDEAWALMPKDEYTTAIITREMQRAYGVACEIEGDAIAARMAFKEAYKRECDESRLVQKPVEWVASIGWDKAGRASVLAEAVLCGKIPEAIALNHLPDETREQYYQAIGHKPQTAIAGKVRDVLRAITQKP